MAQETLANGDTAEDFRDKLNNNYDELYAGKGGGVKEALAFSGGTTSPVSQTDPAVISTITHTFAGTYTSAPKVVIIPKCDWFIYVSSVNTTTVVIGSGSTGSASTLNYDLQVT